LEEKILALLKTVNPGFTHVIVTPVDRTGNNKVFIVNSGSSVFFVKQFFESYEDKRNRFQAEISFIEYAHLCAPGKVPEMYAIDMENKFIIFENVVGNKLKVENINEDLILDAASFFSALNRPELKLTSGKKLLNASEACFSIRDHINLINQRISNLEKVDDNFNTASAFHTITGLIRKQFEEIKKQIIFHANLNGIDINLEIEREIQVISPSDFGFHNCIMKGNNDLIFIDFEYAGWDDPAKVTGDFFG
jgi:hypothetical protein